MCMFKLHPVGLERTRDGVIRMTARHTVPSYLRCPAADPSGTFILRGGSPPWRAARACGAAGRLPVAAARIGPPRARARLATSDISCALEVDAGWAATRRDGEMRPRLPMRDLAGLAGCACACVTVVRASKLTSTSTSGLGERRGVPVACAFWSVLGLNPEKGGEEARRPSVRERQPGNT